MLLVTKDTHHVKLENAAIVNALQLEATQCRADPFLLYYDAMPSLKSLNLSVAIL